MIDLKQNEYLKKAFSIGKDAYLNGKGSTPEHDPVLVKFYFESVPENQVNITYKDVKVMWTHGYYFTMENLNNKNSSQSSHSKLKKLILKLKSFIKNSTTKNYTNEEHC